MTAGVQSFLDSAAALGAGVARASWQACALALAVLLLHRLFGDRIPARVRYNLWLLVLLRLALPVTPGSRVSIYNLFNRDAADGVAMRLEPEVAPAAASEARPQAPDPISGSATELPPGAAPFAASGATPDAVAAPTGTPGADWAPRAARPPVPPIHEEHWSRRAGTSGAPGRTDSAPPLEALGPAPVVASAAAETGPPSAQGLYRAATVAWLAGVLLLLGRVLLASLRLSRSVRRARPVQDPVVAAVAYECASDLGLRRPPAILVGEDVPGPALVGFLRPRLLLPPGVLRTLDRRELRLVLLHEMSHLCRRDVLTNWVLTVLQALHWFNPLVRLIVARVRADRELACDEAVLAVAGRQDRAAYGHTLLKLLDALGRSGTVATTAAGRVGILEFCAKGGTGRWWQEVGWPGANGKRNLTRRITMIARFDQKRRLWTMVATAAGLALGVVTLTDAVAADDKAAETSAVAPAEAPAPDESAPDESARDESAPDESARDESAPDESALDAAPGAGDGSARDEGPADARPARAEPARARRVRPAAAAPAPVAGSARGAAALPAPAPPPSAPAAAPSAPMPPYPPTAPGGFPGMAVRGGYGDGYGATAPHPAPVPDAGGYEMARPHHGPHIVAPPGVPAGAMAGGAPARSRAAVERDAMLARKVTEVNFAGVALVDAIGFLRDVSKANLVVDWRALESAGVQRNTEITLRLRDVSFRKALETALFLASGDKELLDYQADEGVILVSTAQKLRQFRGGSAGFAAPASDANPFGRAAPPGQGPGTYSQMRGAAAPGGAGNRRAGESPNPFGVEPRPRSARPDAAGDPTPAERRRGTSSGRGGSSGSGRAPAPTEKNPDTPRGDIPARR